MLGWCWYTVHSTQYTEPSILTLSVIMSGQASPALLYPVPTDTANIMYLFHFGRLKIDNDIYRTNSSSQVTTPSLFDLHEIYKEIILFFKINFVLCHVNSLID